jgi:thioredoxin 1
MTDKGSLPKSFEELINTSEKPVFVDFYADWCGPCKIVGPIVERIAREYSDRMITVKLDTEQKSEIAALHNVYNIPTLMLFFKGKSYMRLQGALPYETIKQNIETSWP